MMRYALLVLMLVIFWGSALAQPWRVIRNGQTFYTSDINELPEARRKRILAGRAAATKSEKDLIPLPPLPPTAEQVERARERLVQRRKEHAQAFEAKKAQAKAERAADEEAVTTRAEAAKQVISLTSDLATARTDLQQARRKALTVPSGYAYAERSQAEETVKRLEGELKAAQQAAR